MILEFPKWLIDICFYLNALLLLSSCVNWSRYLFLSVLAFSCRVYPQKLPLTIGPEISAKLRSIDPVIVVHALTLTP